ncbi:hypothetical protein WJX82_005644 [Trebouxia sp. C0006]
MSPLESSQHLVSLDGIQYMDTAALTGLNIRMLSVIKRAQQQQGHTGDSDLSKRLSLIEETMQHMVKRHKTGYTETPLHLADEGTLWQQEVQGKAACNIAKVDEMLQPRQSFLAALRYLSLLHEGQKQDARGIVAMKRGRKKGEADLERDYYPHMLNIFQAAAVGQPEIQFQLEDPASADSARPDLRCFVHDVESHPGEAKARNVSSNPITDPDGIHNNKEAFGKLHKVIRAKYLSPGRDQLGVEDAVYKGAGVGWSFLKLQHIGSSLQADPLTMLPHYWSCAQQAVTGLHMAGQQSKAVDDLASLVLSFAWLLNMRTESSIERIRGNKLAKACFVWHASKSGKATMERINCRCHSHNCQAMRM